MKASSMITFLLVGLTGVFMSQVLIPKFFPFLTGTGWDWALTIGVSLMMYLLTRGWMGRIRNEGKLQERYK